MLQLKIIYFSFCQRQSLNNGNPQIAHWTSLKKIISKKQLLLGGAAVALMRANSNKQIRSSVSHKNKPPSKYISIASVFPLESKDKSFFIFCLFILDDFHLLMLPWKSNDKPNTAKIEIWEDWWNLLFFHGIWLTKGQFWMSEWSVCCNKKLWNLGVLLKYAEVHLWWELNMNRSHYIKLSWCS